MITDLRRPQFLTEVAYALTHTAYLRHCETDLFGDNRW